MVDAEQHKSWEQPVHPVVDIYNPAWCVLRVSPQHTQGSR